MAKRTCKGTTKSGAKCKAAPLKGADHCAAHDPKAPDATRFGSPEQAARAGASPKPRALKLSEVLNRRLEEEADAIVAALVDALDASRGVTIRIGDGQDTIVDTPDYATRIAAARELLDRGLGKPRQALEHTGEDGGPIRTEGALDLSKLSTEDLRALKAIHARAQQSA